MANKSSYIKKVTVPLKKVTRKITKKAIPSPKPVPIPEYDIEDDSIELTVDFEGDTIFRFEANITDLSHCCGVREIGNIEVTDWANSSLTEKLKLTYIRSLIQHLLEEYGKQKTFIINTIDNTACNYLVDVIKDGSMFTCVKKFKNNGHGNLISMWISNN